jgi:hypothetical protein
VGFILRVCDLESVVQNWNLFAESPSRLYADRLLRNPFVHTDAHRFINKYNATLVGVIKSWGAMETYTLSTRLHTLSPLLLTVSGSLHLLTRLKSPISSPFQHKNEI